MAGDPEDFLDGEVPEMTDAELQKLRPARDVMTADEMAAVTGRGRPRAAKPKVPVTIRLDPDVVEAYKATGKGWQTKVNATLKESLFKGKHLSLKGMRSEGTDMRSIAAGALTQSSGPRRGRDVAAGRLSNKPKGGKKGSA